MSSGLTRILKEPLIQFLLIGACVYGAYGLFGTTAEDTSDTDIVVNAERINGFVAQWKARWNRPPPALNWMALSTGMCARKSSIGKPWP